MTGGVRSDEKGNSGWYRAIYVSETDQGLLERGKTGEKRVYKYKEGNICYRLIEANWRAPCSERASNCCTSSKYPRITQPTVLNDRVTALATTRSDLRGRKNSDIAITTALTIVL